MSPRSKKRKTSNNNNNSHNDGGRSSSGRIEHEPVDRTSDMAVDAIPSSAALSPSATASPFFKRSQLNAQEKLTVVEWYYANGKNQRSTAEHFKAMPGYEKLSQSSVSRWVSGEAKLRDLVDNGRATVMRAHVVKNPDFETVLKAWLDRLGGAEAAHLTGSMIKQKAAKVYDHLGTPVEERLELSNGWLSSFQQRHGIKLGKPRSHRQSLEQGGVSPTSSVRVQPPHSATQPKQRAAAGQTVPDAVVKREQERIATRIKEFLSWDHTRTLSDVWALDEVPLRYACSPDQSGPRDPSRGDAGRRSSRKLSFTTALCANAAGTERKEPLFVGNLEQPRSFHATKDFSKKQKTGKQLGFQYFYNRGAWVTAEVFYAWLNAWNAELLTGNRHVLLLVDNCSGHKLGNTTAFSNIQLEYFTPRVTEIVQPFCAAVGGIARAFKACFRELVVRRAADKLLSDDFAEREHIFAIDQLAAMDLAKRAWPHVKSETIANCWRNAKILPVDQSSARTDVRPSSMALPEIEELQQAINFLQAEARINGVSMDLMDAATFVNADTDEHGVDDSHLEEIVQLTVGARDMHREGEDGEDESYIENESSSDGQEGVDLRPVQVYKALLDVEQYWRESALHPSDEVRAFLQLTRKHLHEDIHFERQQVRTSPSHR